MVLERLCDSKTASAILHLSQIQCLKNKHGTGVLSFLLNSILDIHLSLDNK